MNNNIAGNSAAYTECAKVQAVIMAAGSSTRTWPLTLTRPKTLLKVANKTILEHNLDQLIGIADEVIIIVGFKKELLLSFGEEYNGIKISYVEQKEPLGTGDAVLQTESLIRDKFIVMNGDDLFFKDDIKKCLAHELCVLAKSVDNPGNFGVYLLDEQGFVKDLVEKPKKFISSIANVGLYVLSTGIFSVLKKIPKSSRGEYELVDGILALSKQQKVFCEFVSGYWFPIVYAWNLLDANSFLLSKLDKSMISGLVEESVFLKGAVCVGEGTVIKSGCYIEGPVIIGKNCRLGPNTYIRPNTVIGDNCHIGQAVEIKNTVIFSNTNVPHLSYVGDSVIGEFVNLGAGTITANLRHDNLNIRSIIKGQLVDSERRKLGTIIGDHVHTGINTTIYPGRKLWPNTTTLPGEVVQRDVVE